MPHFHKIAMIGSLALIGMATAWANVKRLRAVLAARR